MKTKEEMKAKIWLAVIIIALLAVTALTSCKAQEPLTKQQTIELFISDAVDCDSLSNKKPLVLYGGEDYFSKIGTTMDCFYQMVNWLKDNNYTTMYGTKFKINRYYVFYHENGIDAVMLQCIAVGNEYKIKLIRAKV